MAGLSSLLMLPGAPVAAPKPLTLEPSPMPRSAPAALGSSIDQIQRTPFDLGVPAGFADSDALDRGTPDDFVEAGSLEIGRRKRK